MSIDNLLPCDRQAGQFQRGDSIQSTKYSAAVEKIGIHCTENWSNSPFDYIFGVFLWPEYNIKHLLAAIGRYLVYRISHTNMEGLIAFSKKNGCKIFPNDKECLNEKKYSVFI